jgi:hypothetical protein
MRRLVLVVLVLMLCAGAELCQSQASANQTTPGTAVKKSPLVPYAGNWIGTFEGKAWLVLNLSLVGEHFSGSLYHPQHIDVNDNGELKSISEAVVTEPVVEGVLNPDGLLLTMQDPETQETLRYLLRLTGDTTADLKMIGMAMPPGMPKPKPWKLTKAPAAVPKQR